LPHQRGEPLPVLDNIRLQWPLAAWGNTPRQAGLRSWCAFNNIRIIARPLYLSPFGSTNQAENPCGRWRENGEMALTSRIKN